MHTAWQSLRYCVGMLMKKPDFTFIAAGALAVALVSFHLAQSRESARSSILAFTHVTVIDGSGAAAKPDFTVVIVGDRIVEVGPHQRVRIPEDAQIINAGGKFLIPGLWDMHAHFAGGGAASCPGRIGNGGTSVREMGGSREQALARRECVKSGSLLRPRINASVLMLESPRFIQIVERINGESVAGKRIGVANADDARR